MDSLEQFTLQVKLPENITNETFIFESYGFQVFDVNREMLDGINVGANLGPLDSVKNITIPVNISFSDDVDMDTAVYVQVSDTGNNDETYRLSVVAYRQENLFQNDTNGTGVTIASVVMSVTSTGSNPSLTMGFRPIRNTTEEVNTKEEVRNSYLYIYLSYIYMENKPIVCYKPLFMQYMEVCSNFNTGGKGEDIRHKLCIIKLST